MKKFAHIIGCFLTSAMMLSGIYIWRSNSEESQEYDKVCSETVFKINNKFYLLHPDSGESQEVELCEYNDIEIYVFKENGGLYFYYPREYKDEEWITVNEDDVRIQGNPFFENKTIKYFVPKSCNAIVRNKILTPAKFDWSTCSWIPTSLENSCE